MTDTVVEKVIFSDKKAVGVKIKNSKGINTITCTSEIILSGGSINSPQILMLSGIGPKAQLEKHGIPCIEDISGVGQNLQDHLTVNVSSTIKELDTFKELMTPFKMIKNLYAYYFANKGLMTYPASDIGVFFKTKQNISRPDIQIHFAPGAGKYNKNGAMKPTSGITASVCNLRPKSRGY